MHYAVKILRDTDLPEGTDWCVVNEPEHLTACVKRSRATDPAVLAEAWAAVRASRYARELVLV